MRIRLVLFRRYGYNAELEWKAACLLSMSSLNSSVTQDMLFVQRFVILEGRCMQVDKSLEPALEDDVLLLTGAGSVEVLPASGPNNGRRRDKSTIIGLCKGSQMALNLFRSQQWEECIRLQACIRVDEESVGHSLHLYLWCRARRDFVPWHPIRPWRLPSWRRQRETHTLQSETFCFRDDLPHCPTPSQTQLVQNPPDSTTDDDTF